MYIRILEFFSRTEPCKMRAEYRNVPSCKPQLHGSVLSFEYWQRSLAIAMLTLPVLASAAIPMSGSGWPALRQKVDPLVRQVMAENKIPGLTVGVSVKGKQVYKRGFGFAKINRFGIFAPMLPGHRTLLGSTSKPLITAAAGVQLVNALGPRREKLKVYGDGGVFGRKFDADMAAGVSRFWPIAAMAIGTDSRVYTWYTNKTYSIGSTDELDRHQAPKPFSLPLGRNPIDIVGVAISANNRVHAWYRDGAHSVGRANDLSSRAPIALDSKGKIVKTKLPSGAGGFKNVTAIAIGKSSNRIYAWYIDGTYSVGSTQDFGAHNGRRSFKVRGGSRYQIRGIGISPGLRAYTLLSNGKRLKGKVDDLAEISTGVPYTIPGISFGEERGSAGKWFREMTIQQLLDHTAGFWGGGDSDGAAKMFGVPKDDLTYTNVHRYFLRTRPLLDPPGKAIRYSNHGFGLWTLIIERYSGGKSYRKYVVDDYLKPLNLHKSVKPLRAMIDNLDACPHVIENQRPISVMHWDSKLGLAAGGWTASATSMLKLTRHQNQKYSQKQLDNNGWFRSSRGRLSHNGKIRGGTAYVVMYPPGYKPAGTNDDLSDVHIAIAANISTSTSELEGLASAIARQVAKLTYPSDYDLFGTKFPVNYVKLTCF